MSDFSTTPGEMDRDDLLECFVLICNICEPDHPFEDDPYPITPDEVEYGYKQEKSTMYASCGPRNSLGRTKVGYSVDKAYMNYNSPERHLAVLVHEVTHITEGSHSDGSIHNTAFWREMMFNAWQVRDAWDTITEHFDVDEDEFVTECVEDPNGSMTDRRSETVDERRAENARLLGATELALEYGDPETCPDTRKLQAEVNRTVADD